jgi:ABC-2 type transport system permease protein
MPWVFVAVLMVISALTATAVVAGTDMDGSKAFIATGADQQSLMAFAWNAMMGASLFGAIAVAREYGHSTVVPTFLSAPRRHRAVLAQLTAVSLVGGLLGLVGAGLTIGAVALALPATDYGFMLSIGPMTQLLAAAAYAAAVGAAMGAGIGALVRNTGGAVTGAFLVLVVGPPLIVQMANGTAPWMPNTLTGVLSGVGSEVGILAALLGMAAWAAVPATIGLISTLKRDVV